jgi:hypothetical protein
VDLSSGRVESVLKERTFESQLGDARNKAGYDGKESRESRAGFVRGRDRFVPQRNERTTFARE